ncbi:MAG TPA: hypothetical protein DCG57_09350 [Candidatus Riflebacteria bacterium]|nr:hypothetical protein [Candidatus Riflebacteria bacterium]
MRTINRRGFVLYIVITVLLGLAIMAFALNTFKTGAVTQLSRNVDQNRLALLAQSANSEVIAIIKSLINNPESDVFTKVRSDIFPDSGAAISLPKAVDLLSFEPERTLQLAKVGYNLKIRSSAVLTVFRRSAYNSMPAYNGYIDVVSKAWREGSGEITMEAHERRDVRLVDLRHTLDRYALFVKNYSNDYNNTSRRLIVDGVSGGRPYDVSRIYLGTDNYPTCADPRKDLWFDIFFDEHKDMKGFAKLFGSNTLKTFPFAVGTPSDYPKFERLFYVNNMNFTELDGITTDMFILNRQVCSEYERVINLAADACMMEKGVATLPYQIGAALENKCRTAVSTLSNDNALASKMCQDFFKANGTNYSNCEEFKKVLETCRNNWKYRWGYTDAASIWKVDTPGRAPQEITLPERYAGLSNISMGSGNYGPYMAEYREQVDGAQYNPERTRVGVMQNFYGPGKNVPVIIEGNAYLRFFKLAYLDEFTITVQFIAPAPVNIKVITNKYLRKDKTGSFLTTPLNSDELAPNFFSDKMMKSRAIDTISVNTLWGEKIKCYDGDGNESEYDPMANPTQPISLPAQRAGSAVPARNFGRLVDFKNSSWNYVSSADFLKERAPGDGKVLYLDGVMYIFDGDLDLSGVTHFQGKGLIYIASGNCKLGSLERLRAKPTSDSLRIYLLRGDFIIDPAVDDVFIEASLAAFYYRSPGDSPSSDPLKQGSLIMNNRTKITIYGNLLVDSLSLQASNNSGLAENGELCIVHDPAIYNAAATLNTVKLDPFHASIGPVKTSFSFRAGGSEG